MSWWTGATQGTRVGKYIYNATIGAWKKFTSAPEPGSSGLIDNSLLSWNNANESVQGLGVVVTTGEDTVAGTNRINIHGHVHATKLVAGAIEGSVTGNASTASRLATPRTITIDGGMTGSISFDGSSNVTITTATNHAHTWDSITSKPTTFTPSDHVHDSLAGGGRYARVSYMAMFPASPGFGDECYRADLDEWYKYNGDVWTQI